MEGFLLSIKLAISNVFIESKWVYLVDDFSHIAHGPHLDLLHGFGVTLAADVDEEAVDGEDVDDGAVDDGDAVDDGAVDDGAVDDGAVDDGAVDGDVVDDEAVDKDEVEDDLWDGFHGFTPAAVKADYM